MLSLMGCVGILLGTFGILWTWEEQQRRKRIYLTELCGLFRRGKYVLIGQQKSCVDFFREYHSGNEDITQCCKRIGQKLAAHEVATGEQAWRQVWETIFSPMCFSGEEKEIIRASGAAFFGKNRKEVEELFDIYQSQYEGLVEQSRQTHKEKRKVVLPVGALCGIMLIILLI